MHAFCALCTSKCKFHISTFRSGQPLSAVGNRFKWAQEQSTIIDHSQSQVVSLKELFHFYFLSKKCIRDKRWSYCDCTWDHPECSLRKALCQWNTCPYLKIDHYDIVHSEQRRLRWLHITVAVTPSEKPQNWPLDVQKHLWVTRLQQFDDKGINTELAFLNTVASLFLHRMIIPI